MKEPSADADRQGPRALTGSLVYKICVGAAGLGGLVIFLTSVAVAISVVFRNLGFGGMKGDFEMVELACTACAALFLPLCQLTRGHVLVDLFTTWLPIRHQTRLDGFWTIVFGFAWALLAWRLSIGLSEIKGYGDKTMLLGVPVWLVYIPAVFGTGFSAIVAFTTGVPMLAGRAPGQEIH